MQCEDQEIKIFLQNMLVTHAERGIAISRIIGLKERIVKATTWPRGSRPHGFFCGLFEGFEHNRKRQRYELQIAGWPEPLYLETRPHVFAEGTDLHRAPYVGIVSFALPARTADKANGLRCFMQPCYSETNWFPVDSNYERETLELLYEWRQRLPAGLQVTIEKPLFDVPVGATGATCRPDFVLSVARNGRSHGTVAVETMGISGDEYERKKKVTHPLMRARYGLLVQHERRFSDAIRRQLSDRNLVDHLMEALDGKQFPYPTLV